MTEDDKDMAFLDSLLSEEGNTPNALPNEALMARILEDALAAQPLPHLTVVPLPWWRQLSSMIGGWQGVGGLIAATCAGVWIGINPPQSLPETLNNYLNVENVAFVSELEEDTFASFNWDIEENAI